MSARGTSDVDTAAFQCAQYVLLADTRDRARAWALITAARRRLTDAGVIEAIEAGIALADAAHDDARGGGAGDAGAALWI